VAFMKSALAQLGLEGARAIHVRAEGWPEQEGVARAEVVVSRALMDVGRWVLLGAKYASPGGRVVAMMGHSPAMPELDAAGQIAGLRVSGFRTYRLPWSGAERAVATFAA